MPERRPEIDITANGSRTSGDRGIATAVELRPRETHVAIDMRAVQPDCGACDKARLLGRGQVQFATDTRVIEMYRARADLAQFRFVLAHARELRARQVEIGVHVQACADKRRQPAVDETQHEKLGTAQIDRRVEGARLELHGHTTAVATHGGWPQRADDICASNSQRTTQLAVRAGYQALQKLGGEPSLSLGKRRKIGNFPGLDRIEDPFFCRLFEELRVVSRLRHARSARVLL